jgi:hypothetical protein
MVPVSMIMVRNVIQLTSGLSFMRFILLCCLLFSVALHALLNLAFVVSSSVLNVGFVAILNFAFFSLQSIITPPPEIIEPSDGERQDIISSVLSLAYDIYNFNGWRDRDSVMKREFERSDNSEIHIPVVKYKQIPIRSRAVRAIFLLFSTSVSVGKLTVTESCLSDIYVSSCLF